MATLTGKTIGNTTGLEITLVQARSTGAATVQLSDDTVVKVVEGAGRIMAGDYVLADGSHVTAEQITVLYDIT